MSFRIRCITSADLQFQAISPRGAEILQSLRRALVVSFKVLALSRVAWRFCYPSFTDNSWLKLPPTTYSFALRAFRAWLSVVHYAAPLHKVRCVDRKSVV